MDYPIIGLLYQRGFVAIHGSCIVFNEKAGIIVTGFSGAGKSTTASLFRRKGYSIMGDEIGAIRIDNDDTPQLYPSYPEIGLWETSLNLLNDNELAQRGRSRFGSTKYDIAVADSFHDQTVPLKAIFRLEPTDEIEGEVITQLRGIHAMQELRENSLNYLSSVEEFGFLNEYFKKCASLCDKVPIYKVQRLKNNAELYPTADIIEKYVKENSII
jgi:energy-coupling factor transporter ATP-binding protein EcfA2